jgi:hypothetical protein
MSQLTITYFALINYPYENNFLIFTYYHSNDKLVIVSLLGGNYGKFGCCFREK